MDEEHERERAMDLSQNILQLYLEKVDLGLGVRTFILLFFAAL